jgi:hypothetical protein
MAALSPPKAAFAKMTPEEVQGLFQRAWPNRAPPSIITCANVCVKINAVSTGARKEPTAKELAKIKRPARSVVRELKKQRVQIENKCIPDAIMTEDSSWDIVRKENARLKSLLKVIDQAQDSLLALLTLEGPRRPRLRATYIAESAREAWKKEAPFVEIHPGDPATAYVALEPTGIKSVNPEAPLVIFVCAVLDRIGLSRSPATVSEELRGRRDRARQRRA